MEEKKKKSYLEIWAENEIRIACEAERGDAAEGEGDKEQQNQSLQEGD